MSRKRRAARRYCAGGDPAPVQCAPGTYQNATGQTECKACPAGSYCELGQATPQSCPAGSPPSWRRPTTGRGDYARRAGRNDAAAARRMSASTPRTATVRRVDAAAATTPLGRSGRRANVGTLRLLLPASDHVPRPSENLALWSCLCYVLEDNGTHLPTLQE